MFVLPLPSVLTSNMSKWKQEWRKRIRNRKNRPIVSSSPTGLMEGEEPEIYKELMRKSIFSPPPPPPTHTHTLCRVTSQPPSPSPNFKVAPRYLHNEEVWQKRGLWESKQDFFSRRVVSHFIIIPRTALVSTSIASVASEYKALYERNM